MLCHLAFGVWMQENFRLGGELDHPQHHTVASTMVDTSKTPGWRDGGTFLLALQEVSWVAWPVWNHSTVPCKDFPQIRPAQAKGCCDLTL